MEWLKDRKEYWQPSPAGCRAFLISFGFLILGFLTLMIMKSMMNVTQDIVLVAILLLAPVLIFLVLSGKVLEINAGVVSAKFKDIAQEPSFQKELNNKQIEVYEAILTMDSGFDQLHKMLQEMISYKHIILTITLGPVSENYYVSNPEFPILLNELSNYPNFTFIALLDKSFILIGYFPAQEAKQIIISQNKIPIKGKVPLEKAILSGQIQYLREYGMIEEKVNSKDSNLSTLKKMTEKKLNLLLVVNDDGKIEGVVEREQVLSNLMLALTEQ